MMTRQNYTNPRTGLKNKSVHHKVQSNSVIDSEIIKTPCTVVKYIRNQNT